MPFINRDDQLTAILYLFQNKYNFPCNENNQIIDTRPLQKCLQKVVKETV